jgi:hypothetical protein
MILILDQKEARSREPNGAEVCAGSCRQSAPLVTGIPFPKFLKQCLSLLRLNAGDGGRARPNPAVVAGKEPARQGLSLDQHETDATLSRFVLPNGKYHLGAIDDFFDHVVCFVVRASPPIGPVRIFRWD